MMDSLRTLFQSKKFQTFLIGLMLTAAARFGLQLDGETCAAILGLVGILIHAQGQTDLGKEAAKISAPAEAPKAVDVAPDAPKSSGAGTQLTLFAFVIFLGALVATSPACGWLKSTGAAAKAEFTDCEKPALKSAWQSLLPMAISAVATTIANDGKIDTSKLKEFAAPLKQSTERCALTTALTIAAKPPAAGAPSSSSLQADPESAKAAIDDLSTAWGEKLMVAQ